MAVTEPSPTKWSSTGSPTTPGPPRSTSRWTTSADDGDKGEGDLIRGWEGMEGGRGADRFVGGTGTDQFDGGDGNDLLIGGDGADYLQGGNGRDTIVAEAGNDGVPR